MNRLKDIIEACIKEYNKYHSPEAKAEFIRIMGNKLIVKFSGHYCFTCGVYDYFEDFVYLLKEMGVKSKIINIENCKDGNIVELEVMEKEKEFSKIIKEINSLRDTGVGKLVKNRIKEFEKIGKSSEERIFSELCFCILTANFNAERAIRIQEEIGSAFLSLGKRELAKKLKKLGHRYPNTRAEYIVDARKKLNELMKVLNEKNTDEFEKREWIVKNIKGLGYKEASHFLRNIGYKNLAIIDFHILDLLWKNGFIEEKPKSLTKNKYLEIERILKTIAEKIDITLAELDLYLWYIETGKVLK